MTGSVPEPQTFGLPTGLRVPIAARDLAVLFPEHQLWVHVDFNGYRKAWIDLGMPEPGRGIVLDHIANREATRARGMLHPFIRLCPVSRRINTNAGHSQGGEGMEREYTEYLNSLSPEERAVRTAGLVTVLVGDLIPLVAAVRESSEARSPKPSGSEWSSTDSGTSAQ